MNEFEIVEFNNNGNYIIDALLSGGTLKGEAATLLISGEINPLPVDLKVIKGEDNMQICFIDWVRMVATKHLDACRWIHHIGNGGQRTKKSGALMKRMGVKKGIADIFWPYKGINGENGLYIEFKVQGFHQSEEQVEFQQYCIAENYSYHIAYSPMDAISYVSGHCGLSFK